ncbi:hypothetical protein [Moraxella lacunata]|uniref:hypothetical protein n=1 Tax=Moraxella lacunata TaxID=477 RepID=UPI003EE31D0F
MCYKGRARPKPTYCSTSIFYFKRQFILKDNRVKRYELGFSLTYHTTVFVITPKND